MTQEDTGAFAERLKQLRKRAALSQQDLARRAGVDDSTIARLEAGGQPPRPSTIRKLARALDLEPGRLTGSPESEPEAHDKRPKYSARQEAALDAMARIFATALQREFDVVSESKNKKKPRTA